MGDFYQTGVVATFHRLKFDRESLERQILEYSKISGITLVLPSLYSELHGPGLKIIIEELKEVKYLREIILSLGPADEKQFREMKDFFKQLPQKVKILWNSGPRITAIYDEIRANNLNPGPDGKGRSAWMSYGYILAEGGSRVICLHDCDIVTYNRDLLGRLVYPVVSPSLNYEFCKGFYSRATDRMHGRVTRLFVTPLIRALQSLVGRIPILIYLDSFRYPLAGEFAMTAELANLNRIPADWGLEVGVLWEVYRNATISRICQSELIDNYEHKHQELSPENQEKGLNKMSVDIAKSILRTLLSEGIVYPYGFFNVLRASYLRIAEDMIQKYYGDASINSLLYDRHAEESTVEVFAEAIRNASDTIMNDPLGPPLIPNWARVFSAIPNLQAKILEAVRLDNEM